MSDQYLTKGTAVLAEMHTNCVVKAQVVFSATEQQLPVVAVTPLATCLLQHD